MARRKVTVDDILSKDEVIGVLAEVVKERSEIEHAAFIWIGRDGQTHRAFCGTNAMILWAIEQAKLSLMGIIDEDK